MLPMESNLTSQKMVENAKKFKNFLTDMKLDNINLNNEKTQRLRNTMNKGLTLDNELYRKLIISLKKSNLVHKTKDFMPSDEELQEIVVDVYKNYHISSLRRLKKFIDKYNKTIQEDINSK